jgi:hypothetical protein
MSGCSGDFFLVETCEDGVDKKKEIPNYSSAIEKEPFEVQLAIELLRGMQA